MRHETQLVSYLIYCSYKSNRQASPEVTPQQWEPVFGSRVYELEKQYQAELYGEYVTTEVN